MPGPVPKDPAKRRRRNVPASGEWKKAAAVGWQHGAVPEPPDGLLSASKKAWKLWFASWWAAFWVPEDLPGLETVIALFDATRRGELQRSGELRQSMDAFGLTPLGRQKLHWLPPKAEDTAKVEVDAPNDAYRHLRAL